METKSEQTDKEANSKQTSKRILVCLCAPCEKIRSPQETAALTNTAAAAVLPVSGITGTQVAAFSVHAHLVWAGTNAGRRGAFVDIYRKRAEKRACQERMKVFHK